MGKSNWGMRACSVFLLWATVAAALPAQTFTTLHNFSGTDGHGPWAGLVQATDGNLYGTTIFGGVDGGSGTAFEITPAGLLTTVRTFTASSGSYPSAGLVQGSNGDFYGAAESGGTKIDGCLDGCGTVFEIAPNGQLKKLHTFDITDGVFPEGTLVEGNEGNLYGTTEFGGAYGSANGGGTVFKITPNGILTTLHSFDGTDGNIPREGLVEGAIGNFYGTTLYGGANGEGTVFKITPSGTLTTLYSFCAQVNSEGSCTDGSLPIAGLVQAANGDFYGTTGEGGANGGSIGSGTVFKITPSGTLTTLYNFCSRSGCTDGATPTAGLVESTDGDFYGTTVGGGANDQGTVFKITPNGRLTVLHSFDGTDGANAEGALIQDTDGDFYGTTYSGGINDEGTVFSLSVGLGPFVETRPTTRRIGGAVEILGTNLTGATSVTFNGTPATFTVVSASEITATVPAGATTGTVKALTPSGTLSSNVPFRVIP